MSVIGLFSINKKMPREAKVLFKALNIEVPHCEPVVDFLQAFIILSYIVFGTV